MAIAASAPHQASCDIRTCQLQDPPSPATGEPALPVFAGDRFALLFWGGCALLLVYLLMKDLVVSHCHW